MGYGVRLHIWGDRACFTRPEMKGERVSYDVITPSAARGILEAIHWKPAIRWQVDRIHVLKPIRFETFRRNEVGSKIPVNNVSAAQKRGSAEGLANYVEEDRQQRAMTLLRDVAYIIEAHFDMTDRAGPGTMRASIWTSFVVVQKVANASICHVWGYVSFRPASDCWAMKSPCLHPCFPGTTETGIWAGCCMT